MKKKPVIICLVCAGALSVALYLPQSPLTKDYKGTRSSFNLDSSQAISGEGGYQFSFPLDNNPSGTINCYMLRYRPMDYDTAKKYAGMFIGVDSYAEDENSFVFTGSQGVITIEKEINRIHFEAVPNDGNAEPLRSERDAIKTAADFIQKRLLTLIYEECQVHSDGDYYRVKFINRIGNLKNFAFPDQVTMDNRGNVSSMDYYAVHYDKVGECNIKSMRNAFEELPALKAGDTVLLSGCQLVYMYEDSIIQPAYYFQGSAGGGNTFECYVKAAVY